MPDKQAILNDILATVREPNQENLEQIGFDRDLLQMLMNDPVQFRHVDMAEVPSLARVILVIIQARQLNGATLSFSIASAIAKAEITPGGRIDAEADAWIIEAIYQDCEVFREVRDSVSARFSAKREKLLNQGVIDNETTQRFLDQPLKENEMRILAERLRQEDPGVYGPVVAMLARQPKLQTNLEQLLRM